MNAVVDTHALLWHLIAPDKLGAGARAILTAADRGEAQILVPVLVLAELSMIAERNRVPGWTPQRVDVFARLVSESDNYAMSPLSDGLVLASRDLTAIPDIFDRLIAAEARELQVPLVTRDPVIPRSGAVPVIWEALP